MGIIIDATKAAAKWARVTPGRTQDYEEGVRNPRVDWASATKAAEDVYKIEVTKAANEGRFGRGVAAAGTAKWQEGAINKGVQRWGPGVQLGQAAYEKGFAPIAAAIAAVNLPPRRGKNDPQNYKRSQMVGEAAHKARLKR